MTTRRRSDIILLSEKGRLKILFAISFEIFCWRVTAITPGLVCKVKRLALEFAGKFVGFLLGNRPAAQYQRGFPADLIVTRFSISLEGAKYPQMRDARPAPTRCVVNSWWEKNRAG